MELLYIAALGRSGTDAAAGVALVVWRATGERSGESASGAERERLT